METVRKGALRLASSVCLAALAACSGGGGGGNTLATSANNSTSNNTTPNNTTSNNTTSGNTTSGNTTSGSTTSGSTTSNTTPASFTISAPDIPTSSGVTSPGFNFTTNLPPVGTTFLLDGTVVKATSTSVSGAGLTGLSAGTATYEGVATSNGVTYPIFNLNVPTLGFTATNVHGDGTTTTTNNGGSVAAATLTLNYTLLGAWTYTPPGGGTSYLGQLATGSITPVSAVPTSGSATYNGNGPGTGGVIGAYAVNNGNGTAQAGALDGNVSITANFAQSSVSGTMTNMTATAAGATTSTPWNNVTLAGHITLSGPINSVGGITQASAAPTGAGAAAFTTAAQGSLVGAFYGPNAQELGATWTLYEPTNGGKAAFGTIGATAATTP